LLILEPGDVDPDKTRDGVERQRTPAVVSRPVVPAWFVGRAPELELLTAAIRDAARGWGGVVVVSGPRGIGKSRLIQEAGTRAAPSGRVIDGSVMLAEASRERLPGVALESLRRSLHQTVDAAGDEPSIVIFDGIDDGDAWMRELFAGWDVFVPSFGARGMILAAVRSEPDRLSSIARALERGGRHVELGALSKQETQMLLRVATPLDVTLSHPLAEKLEHLCEGSPALICELLECVQGNPDPNNLPLSLLTHAVEAEQQLLMGANTAARRFVIAAAVAGERFDVELVARTAGFSQAELGQALPFLIATKIFDAALDRTGVLAFRRPIFREIVLQGLVPALAERLHARFGEELDLTANGEWLAERAYHWSRAGNPQRAAAACEAAGDETQIRKEYETAARWYAMAQTFAEPERYAVLGAKRVEALSNFSRGSALLAACEENLNFAEGLDPVAVARMLVRAMGSSWLECQPTQAHALGERIEELGLPPDTQLLIHARIQRAEMYAYEQQYGAARRILTDIAASVDIGTSPERLNFYFAWVGAQESVRSIESIYARLRCVHRLAERAGNQRLTTVALNWIARTALIAGRLDIAQSAVRDAHKFATEIRAADAVTQCELVWAEIAFMAGDFSAARTMVLSAMSRSNDVTVVRISFSFGIWIGLLLDDSTLVEVSADERLIDAAFRSRAAYLTAMAGANFAELLVSRGDWQGAQSLLSRAVKQIRRLDGCFWFPVTVARHGTPEDWPAARELLASRVMLSDESAQAFLALFDAVVARREKRWHEAARTGLDAAAAFHAFGIPYFEAQAYEAAGRTAQALAIYERIGDVRDAERLTQRRVRRGSEGTSLTRREREVARLAATGLRSQAIAEELGLRVLSVETYLKRAYAKLGIHARQQLPLDI
jgi:DNA-binding CsgD family transcriptional regulator